MNLEDLIKSFRIDCSDRVEPYLFPTDVVSDWLIEAEMEAAIRGRLLHENCNPLICNIELVPELSKYDLHPSLYEIDYIAIPEKQNCPPIKIVSVEWLTEKFGQRWRTMQGTPEYVIQDEKSLRFIPTPNEPLTVAIEGFRLPIKGLSRDKQSTPEIHAGSHRRLIDFALYRAYSTPDSDTLDVGRADLALNRFTRYFGERPDCDLRRITREDVAHHNKICDM
jgi:hypothetical protein